MSGHQKSKQQISQQYVKLNQLYNSLLQKNQNDLIKIRQKQKTFEDTINSLKDEKLQMEKKYKNHVDVLMLELEKLKGGESKIKQNAIKNSKDGLDDILLLKQQILGIKKQNKTLREIIEQKGERIDHLEQNARKLIDQNIYLTSQNEKLKKQFQILAGKIQKLTKQKQQLQIQFKDTIVQRSNKKIVHRIQVVEESQQTEGDYVISYKQHNSLISKFNHQILQLNKSLQQQQKTKQELKSRLKQTNEQLKRFMQRDRKNAVIIKKKSQQIQNVQAELQRKSHKPQKVRMATQQSCLKCKQWQQENKLLKQMVKSMQTMVRVREMEAQRYKNREAMNNSINLSGSKVHQKTQQSEPKKTKRQLPPLSRKN